MTDRENSSRPLALVHSPLVGASFWHPVRTILEGEGWRCPTPGAGAHMVAPMPWHAWPTAVRDELGAAPGAVLVGHSAAGYLLPSLAHALEDAALCGAGCVDVTANPTHGSCANVCDSATEVCINRRCQCKAGLFACTPGAFLGRQTNEANCGTCGFTCPGNKTCQAGDCVP